LRLDGKNLEKKNKKELPSTGKKTNQLVTRKKREKKCFQKSHRRNHRQ